MTISAAKTLQKMTAQSVKQALLEHADPDDAVFLQRFFKTGKGEYGEGDQFIGVRVPTTRQVCHTFKNLPLAEVQKLFDSPVHEHRLAGAILLAEQYKSAPEPTQRLIYELYVKNVQNGRINNWDIIDTTAEYVIGAHLKNRPRKILFSLAHNANVWPKRVAIMSTFGYIKAGDPATTLGLIDILLYDPHDLIQKAVGWMLREIGKRVDEQLLVDFLERHARDMPRTTLRYSIEKLSPDKKERYMHMRHAAV